jgi:hypothetical protein
MPSDLQISISLLELSEIQWVLAASRLDLFEASSLIAITTTSRFARRAASRAKEPPVAGDHSYRHAYFTNPRSEARITRAVFRFPQTQARRRGAHSLRRIQSRARQQAERFVRTITSGGNHAAEPVAFAPNIFASRARRSWKTAHPA